MWKFVTENLGVSADALRWREHGDEERSFYSKRTEDIEYKFPFGFKELWGLAYRTDYDLNQHMKFSGVDLSYTDPTSGKKFVPHVIEPAVGVNRLMAMVMLDAYTEDGDRVYLKLKPRLAPYKAAVFPLLANKPALVEKARQIHDTSPKAIRRSPGMTAATSASAIMRRMRSARHSASRWISIRSAKVRRSRNDKKTP